MLASYNVDCDSSPSNSKVSNAEALAGTRIVVAGGDTNVTRDWMTECLNSAWIPSFDAADKVGTIESSWPIKWQAQTMYR